MKENLETVNKVKDYIDSHLSEELKLDQLAEYAGYSKFHLCRIFSEEAGMTIHQYIQKGRLAQAARLLADTNQTISDIAAAYGYEYQQSFQLAFKNRYQETPLQYRRKHQYGILHGYQKRGQKYLKLSPDQFYMRRKYEVAA